MKRLRHFKAATYIHAYDIEKMSEAEIGQRIERFQSVLDLDKLYIENHRGIVDIPVEKLSRIKALAESYGLKTAGGITCTQYINKIRKGSFYDTFCFTDPAHRQECIRIANELATVFDEIILDDFFFTACRCEMCIDAKGDRSWKDYHLSVMEEFSAIMIGEAKKVNPNLKFVIKFPNWYESYQENGYYPGKQKDLFDGIYTGTETRTPFDAQHLQRYTSYSIMRLMEQAAPGKNGGGWVDLFGSLDCTNNLLEQMEATMLGGAKEIMLWNFGMYSSFEDLPVLADFFYKLDERMDQLGAPVGFPVWEPFNGDAEEQIYNYLGMIGTALSPTPYFDPKAQAYLFTASTAAEAPESVDLIKEFVRKGGSAVVTLGYYRAMYDKGIQDLSSVRLTSRHVIGKDFRIQNANYYNDVTIVKGEKPVLFQVISYKTNATNCDISVMADECNFPVMTEDNYGKGRFFILNMPDNYADLYKLPKEVLQTINKHLSMGQRAYLAPDFKCSLYAFDNGRYVLRSFSEEDQKVQMIVRAEDESKIKGIRNMETGEVVTEKVKLNGPSCMMDATTVQEEPAEYVFNVNVPAKTSVLLELI